MKRYAIILSSEEYKDDMYDMTYYCHNDAYLLNETLVKYCDFAEQDIYNDVLSIFDDKEPKDILKKIEEVVENSQEGDTILFYYAGHGEYIDGDSYLVLPKTNYENIKQTAISIRDINGILRKRNRVNVRIFDCCHSGLDARSSNILLRRQSDFTENINKDNEGWCTFASCTAKQESYPDSNLEHGVFTYYLTEAIREYKQGTEIMPEILKLEVCNKVAKWCEEKKIVQTPTFNASIAGNISFAVRKKEEVKIDCDNNKDGADDGSLELQKQVELMRKSKKNNSKENIEKLQKYIDVINNSLNKNKDIINRFDLNIEEIEPCSVNDIWDDYIKDSIVKFLDDRRYNSFHKYNVKKNYEEDTRPKFLTGMFPKEPKLLSINYNIKQPHGFPVCYVSISLIGDGYLKRGDIFGYVCPLQFTTCIIFGIAIDEKVVMLRSVNLEAGDEIDNIDEIVKKLLNSFNNLYEQNVKKCIRDYNEEIKVIRKDIF